jgi:hypothetical protein
MKTIGTLVLLLASTTFASASVTQINGAFPGNDDEATVEGVILAETGVTVDLDLYDKSDGGPVLTTVTGGGGLSGTWDVIDDSILITYVTVKAGNFFTLYEYNPGQNSGDWTTAGILNNGGQQPAMSHLSFWTGPNTFPGGDPVVPEPMTMGLFGGGLGALFLLRKKIHKA